MRDAGAYFDEIPRVALADEMKELADVIIKRKSGTFDTSEFKDRYEDAVVELVKSKQAGGVVHSTSAVPDPGNVINLMEALRRSLGEPASSAKAGKKDKVSAEPIPAKPPAASKTKGAKEEAQNKAAGKRGDDALYLRSKRPS